MAAEIVCNGTCQRGFGVEDFRAVRMLITDVDGVMTDGSITVNADGSESKTFNVKDGSGLKYLMRSGIRVAMLSGRECAPVEQRAQNLGVDFCVTGALDKLPAYRKLLDQAHLTHELVCYVGDDLPDIPPMRHAGIPVAVSDAVEEARQYAAYVTAAPGGGGAIRELAELILRVQGKWDTVMQRYVS
jgi:3-deoxy-D-manno-octulosonate 8-phosphate phosphatase (KDO 8-P phosphatase)